MSDIVEELVKEANELPDPRRNLLTHNEHELVKFCFRMRDAIQDLRAENEKLRAEVDDLRATLRNCLTDANFMRAAAAALKETGNG